MRLATVAGIVALVAAGAVWCTTTTLNQIQADRKIEASVNAAEKAATRLEEVEVKNERRYESLRQALDDIRYRIALSDEPVSHRPPPFSPDRSAP